MSARLPVTPAPGPLERYAQGFDELFSQRSQREAFRRYLEGLLLPTERNKTLTALAQTEPVVGSTHREAQKLQWFLSESRWDPEELNHRRVQLLRDAPATAPTAQGVVVIDETGDRKWGSKTAHVGRQYLGSIGKIDQGVVSVSSLWADERVYYPLALRPYTPAPWFAGGRADAAFRTKPQLAGELVQQARAVGIPFRAVVADSFYGEHEGFKAALHRLGIGYVVALKPSHAWWHRDGEVGSVQAVARAAAWQAEAPGQWQPVVRTFRDGHQEHWWALEAQCGPYGPAQPQRLIIATTDPAQLPELTTWYLTTNLPAPGVLSAPAGELAIAELAEVIRLYGLRIWIEQSYKQVKTALGWAQYQVRSDLAIRRHWQLVWCAFSFCWWAESQEASAPAPAVITTSAPPATAPLAFPCPRSTPSFPARKKKDAPGTTPPDPAHLAPSSAPRALVVGTVSAATALLASVVKTAPAAPTQRLTGMVG
jgi:SRSO17 transposase